MASAVEWWYERTESEVISTKAIIVNENDCRILKGLQ